MTLIHERGKIGESLAENYLLKNGYKIVARRFRIRGGEIDLVVLDGETLVFVEVKTRVGDKYGAPEEAINFFKQRHLRRAVAHYLARYPKWRAFNIRIDAVLIDIDTQTRRAKLKHIKYAIGE